jgi:hypothetical protein
VSFILPIMGGIYDQKTTAAIPAGTTQAQLSQAAAGTEAAAKWAAAQAEGGAQALRYVALLPVVLIVVFGLIWLRDRARGGYRAEKLDAA